MRSALGGFLLLAFFAPGLAAHVRGGEWWLSHAIGELMPFWHQPAAWDEPAGNFPAAGCDNGALLDPEKPCPEIWNNAPPRAVWSRQSLVALSRQSYAYGALFHLTGIMAKHFSSAKDNIDFLRADTAADADLQRTGADFGHSIKALWMTRMTGQLSGDGELVRQAEERGKALLERACLSECGCWANGVKAGGALDLDKSWWVYAELDQFAASVALSDRSFAEYLPRTYGYWLEKFVDKRYGEVWATLDGVTHQPKPGTPKQSMWKNGYHSLEHALVAYITSQQLSGEPVTLYYNFPKDAAPEQVRPYFSTGRAEAVMRSTDWREGEIQKVVFRDVR